MKQVEAEIWIERSPQEVLEAFVDDRALSKWWGVERTLIKPEEGGLYTLIWGVGEQGFKYVSSGLIERFSRQGELHIANMIYLNPERPPLGPMELSIRVEASGNGSRLEVRQTGYLDGDDWLWYYQAVQEGWPLALKNLKEYLETNT